jgi:hypothetical protein
MVQEHIITHTLASSVQLLQQQETLHCYEKQLD